jgi:hypothetical protein
MHENPVLVFQYPTMDAAKPAWERVRDAILLDDLDASVYRTMLNGQPLVIIVGTPRLADLDRSGLSAMCSDGQPTDIPDDVAAYLIERREQVSIPGAFWERRTL